MLRIILLFSVLAGGAFSTLSAEDYYSVYYLRVTVPHHGGDVQGFVVVAGFPEDSAGDAAYVEQRLRREVVNGQLVLYGQRFLYQTPDEQTHFILMEPRTVPIRASTPLSIEVLERTSALDYITGQFQPQDTLWLKQAPVAHYTYYGYLSGAEVLIHTPDETTKNAVAKLEAWKNQQQVREELTTFNGDAADAALSQLLTPLLSHKGVVVVYSISD